MKALRYITFPLIYIFGYVCLCLYDNRVMYYSKNYIRYLFKNASFYPSMDSSLYFGLFFISLVFSAVLLVLHWVAIVMGEPGVILTSTRKMNKWVYVGYSLAIYISIFIFKTLLLRDANGFNLIFYTFLAYLTLMLWLDGTVYRTSQYFNENSRIRRDYDAALADQVKAERFKTELITNVSHDIKTPLTSIISYIDLIDRLNIDHPELNSYVTVLQKKARRLKTLLDDLLEATKAGSGDIPVSLTPIDFAELIGQAAGEFEELFQEKHLEWVFTRGQFPAEVMADGRHLYRVLENITANAGKHALAGTRVYAGLQADGGGHIVFTLKNISQEPLNISASELTERFVRGDRARHTEGSGLGLYIAKSLTEAIGGTFDLEINGDLFCVTVTLAAPTRHGYPSTAG